MRTWIRLLSRGAVKNADSLCLKKVLLPTGLSLACSFLSYMAPSRAHQYDGSTTLWVSILASSWIFGYLGIGYWEIGTLDIWVLGNFILDRDKETQETSS